MVGKMFFDLMGAGATFDKMISRIFLRPSRKCWLLGSLFLLQVLSQSSWASLVIMVYHDDTMYLAADSVGSYDGKHRMHTVQKIFPFATNCCASITGFAGYDLTNSAGEIGFSLDLVGALSSACVQQMTNPVALDEKIKTIANQVNEALNRYYDLLKKWPVGAMMPDGTMLQFVGYDAAADDFFVDFCKLDQTNVLTVQSTKKYRGPTDAQPFSMQGDFKFLQTMISGEKPELVDLASEKFKDTLGKLTDGGPLDDASITNFLLEMYSLHTANAARLGYSQVLIGPPYRIFKITKQNVHELTSDPTAVPASEAAAARLHTEDDKAIDAVMDKLAVTFKANDYSYAFDVMYTPILDSMGGREKVEPMVPVLKQQMEQLQMSVLSWETQKPYNYIRGDGRWYAVITYGCEMTMTGQKIKLSGYQLGIKIDGSSWQFVSGEKLTPEVFSTFFPDFPKDVELPKLQRVIE